MGISVRCLDVEWVLGTSTLTLEAILEMMLNFKVCQLYVEDDCYEVSMEMYALEGGECLFRFTRFSSSWGYMINVKL